MHPKTGDDRDSAPRKIFVSTPLVEPPEDCTRRKSGFGKERIACSSGE
ncbi:MAG: hypothetical protein M0Q91_15600 [Methanoregula sp.]|nr:hypothetical protein [Methanoregula sp.]